MSEKLHTYLLLVCLLILPGCGKPRASFDEILATGIEDYQNRQYSDALSMFKHAKELDRERPEPSYYVGLCYMGMADQHFQMDNLHAALRCCDQAVAAFDSAVGAFPGYSRSVQGKADALRLKGKHQAALDIATWAAAQSGGQSKMLILKGRQYAQNGDIDRAQLSFKQATSVEPNNPAAFAELGLFYMRCGNDTEAVKALRRANELDPGAPGVVAALARLGAVNDATEAVHEQPDDADYESPSR